MQTLAKLWETCFLWSDSEEYIGFWIQFRVDVGSLGGFGANLSCANLSRKQNVGASFFVCLKIGQQTLEILGNKLNIWTFVR